MSATSHITLGTNDEDRAAEFYAAVLGTLGFERLPKPPGLPPALGKIEICRAPILGGHWMSDRQRGEMERTSCFRQKHTKRSGNSTTR